MVNIPKTPEDLEEKDLGKAMFVANVFTNIRKFCYFFVPVTTPIFVIYLLYLRRTPEIILQSFSLFVTIYGIFKLRDYIRGNI